MARSNIAGSGSNRFNSAVGTVPATAVSLTMACWFKLIDATDTSQTLISLRLNTEVDNHRFTLSALLTRQFLATTRVTTDGIASTVNLITSGAWSHGVGVFNSDRNRRAILNGDWANSNSDITELIPIGVNQIQIGIRGTSTFPLRGEIAEVAVWIVALTQAEVELLATGASPRRVQIANLAFYAPLRGGDSSGNELDVIGGTLMTEDGTMGMTNHPPKVILKSGVLLYEQ